MHLLYLLYIGLAISTCFVDALNLVAVHGSARHGERGANYRVRNLNVAHDYLNGGNTGGDNLVQKEGVTIVPAGFRNSHALGVYLRNRYKNYDFVNRDNQTLLTRIRVSDYGRIQEVGNAFADGFFGHNWTLPNSVECVLPSCYSSPWIPTNPEIFPYKNCFRYGEGGLERAENSIMTKYPAFFHDEFIALVEQNATLADWYYNVWEPRVEPYYALGIRLNSTGGIYISGRAVQVELRDGYQLLLNNLITLEELNNPLKFGGLLDLVFGNFLLPILDAATSHQYASMPYLDALIRELLSGNDPTAQETYSSIEGNIYKPEQRPMFYFDMGHSQTVDYRFRPQNSNQFTYASQGDAIIFELWEDEYTKERFIRIYSIKRFITGSGDNDFTLHEITPPTCSNFTCPLDEWLENLEFYTSRDTKTECSALPKCISESIATDQWSTGAIYSIDITSGWYEFGWTAQLTFSHGNFSVINVWDTVLIDKTDNIVTLRHPSTHNYEAFANVNLEQMGMEISKPSAVEAPIVIESRFFNTQFDALLVCDDPSKKRSTTSNHVYLKQRQHKKNFTIKEIFNFFDRLD